MTNRHKRIQKRCTRRGERGNSLPEASYRALPVVNGGKQRALFGWHDSEAICARPMAQARRLWERTARSTRQRQRETTGATRDGPREACLVSADPWDTGL